MGKDDYIRPENLKDVADGFNNFIGRADRDRSEFSKLLLTIYTPVSSGLLLLATRLSFRTNYQKVVFLAVATSSILIVLSALLEKLGYFLSSQTQAKKYVDHVRKTGEHLSKPVSGKRWEIRLISAQVYILATLLLINMVFVLLTIYSFALTR